MNFMDWWVSKFSFNLKVFFFPFQGSSEAEPVLQAEEAPALAAPPTGALHLPHQLQRHPAGLAAPCPAMPAPSRVQSEREPRDGKGENSISIHKRLRLECMILLLCKVQIMHNRYIRALLM